VTAREPTVEQSLTPDSTATPWSKAVERLENPEKYRTYWLTTIRPDGRPHVMPLLGLWLDGAFYFLTGERTRKGQNLSGNRECVLTFGSQTIPALDFVIEGEATRVTGKDELQRVVDAYASKMGWPLEIRDGAVFGPNAPTAGPPPFAVFELTPSVVFGLPGVTGTDEEGGFERSSTPTRWRF
jgi:hypothetical protein